MFHTSKTAKMMVILLSSTLTLWQGALSNITFIIFAVFDVWNNAQLPLTVFFYYICWLSIIPSYFIDSESGVTTCNQFRFRIRRPDTLILLCHRASDHSTRHRYRHYLYLLAIFWNKASISSTFRDIGLYWGHDSRHQGISIRVTWSHRSRKRSIEKVDLSPFCSVTQVVYT